MKEFNYKKKYGQNFLIDYSVVNKIANIIPINENDLIVEIGPGNGKLTRELVTFNSYYIGYEIDNETKDLLNKYVNNKVNFVFKDFLQVDLAKDIMNIKYDKLYVIANLPYYITTPIIEHLIDSNVKIDQMILMVQNEVADRLCAKPKTSAYGYFTVYLNNYYKCEKQFVVLRNSFEPVPNVDSAIILLTGKDNPNPSPKLIKLLKDAFHLKRKNLRNNLQDYNLETITKVLSKYGLNLTARAEELSLDIFIDIANNLE